MRLTIRHCNKNLAQKIDVIPAHSDAEAEGLSRVPGQPGLHSKILSQRPHLCPTEKQKENTIVPWELHPVLRDSLALRKVIGKKCPHPVPEEQSKASP